MSEYKDAMVYAINKSVADMVIVLQKSFDTDVKGALVSVELIISTVEAVGCTSKEMEIIRTSIDHIKQYKIILNNKIDEFKNETKKYMPNWYSTESLYDDIDQLLAMIHSTIDQKIDSMEKRLENLLTPVENSVELPA